MNDKQRKLTDAIITNTKLNETTDGLFGFLHASIFASSSRSNELILSTSRLHEDHPGG